MAPPKGKVNNPNGRPAGGANKVTTQAREAIASFVEGNVDRLTGWLDRMAEENPKDAFNAFMAVVEYHIPKLARTTVAGDPENPIHIISSAKDDAILAHYAKQKPELFKGEKTE